MYTFYQVATRPRSTAGFVTGRSHEAIAPADLARGSTSESEQTKSTPIVERIAP